MPEDDKDLDAMLADLLGDKKEEKKPEKKEEKTEEKKEEPKPVEPKVEEKKEALKHEVKHVVKAAPPPPVAAPPPPSPPPPVVETPVEAKRPEPAKADREDFHPPTLPERPEPKIEPRPEIVPLEEKPAKAPKKHAVVEAKPEAPALSPPPAPAPTPEPVVAKAETVAEVAAPAPIPTPAQPATTVAPPAPVPSDTGGEPAEQPKDLRTSMTKRKAMRKEVTDRIELPLIFGKWDTKDVVVHDIALRNYINLEPVMSLHSGARYANKQFGKANVHIVERLINGMMRTEHTTGEKAKTTKWVIRAFDIIHEKTKKNPVQVYVDALLNGAPKEEVTRLRFGGISVPKAVDVSSSRRLDVALRNICNGAMNSAHGSKKRIWETLASEIILCANKDMNSHAMAKRDEVERVAGSAR